MTHVKLITLFPIRWVQGENWDSFVMVSVSAFAPIQEHANNLNCRVLYIVGKLLLETRTNKEEILMR